MIAVINDVSFMYSFETIAMAIEGMHKFLDICIRIKKDEVTNIQDIKAYYIDSQIEIGPGYKLIQLVQEFKSREERTLLLSILTNHGSYKAPENCNCQIAGKKSLISELGAQTILISLLSDQCFSFPILNAEINNQSIEIKNISKNEHFDIHRFEIGLRKYNANAKKHKRDRENPYGKGKIGSRMDLSDEEAQDLLNKAVCIKGRLYGKKNGYYYAFQNERDIIYHGYRVDDLGEDIRSKLDKK